MKMEKTLIFTNDEKSLIWRRIVLPAGGIAEEAQHFVSHCECLGLNPLVEDIVFRKSETGEGARVSFIPTRDGLLRAAARHPDFAGPPASNVVREGDEFELLPAEGTVRHKFGMKRGKILGAYAVLPHRRFRPLAVWADFEEHFQNNARSQEGRSSLWDQLPSAMIQKVAESVALRRQFPLGGPAADEALTRTDGQDTRNERGGQEREKAEGHSSKMAPASGGKGDGLETNKPDPDEPPEGDTGPFLLERVEQGVSPGGIDFAKVSVVSQETGERMLILARGGEKVEMARGIPPERPFTMETRQENGFIFLESVHVLDENAIA